MQRTETKAKHCPITNLFYTDRSGMNEMNKFLSMSMMRKEEPCEDIRNDCQRWKKKCDKEKVKLSCKKTCGLCQDSCHDTLENLHCLSKGLRKG